VSMFSQPEFETTGTVQVDIDGDTVLVGVWWCPDDGIPRITMEGADDWPLLPRAARLLAGELIEAAGRAEGR
jgi:hypothetical protein